jgi:outer membrane protein, multidrug efflux system
MNARVLLVLSLSVLAACYSSPGEHKTDVAVPDRWADPAHASTEPPQAWWKEFGDPELDSLIDRAVHANLDVAIAQARVREARALHEFSSGALLPQVNAHAVYTRSKLSENTAQPGTAQPQNLWDVGFDALWEVDLFGSNRSAVSAAQAGLEAAEENRRDALVTLLGEVARNYVELRGAQQQIALTKANAESQRRTLELTRSRFQAGLSTQLDVARAQTLLSNTDSLVPSLEIRVASAVHQLSVLLGEPPATLGPELTETKPVPTAQGAAAELASGLPSDLLRRRPDIRRAERELAQAAALTDEATANLYPKLTIGATLGLQSQTFNTLGSKGSDYWSIGPGLFAPIFHGGELRAAVRVQNAQQEQALDRYRLTVLGAFQEVEDALSAVARERERRQSLQESVASSRQALELANDLQLRGLIDFFEVLDAQRSQLLAEAALAQSDTNLSSETVALYKALGGGWENLDTEGDPAVEGSGPSAHSSESADR